MSITKDRWYRGELIAGPNVYGMYSWRRDDGTRFAADTLAGIKETIRENLK